jgi:KTSC domain
VKRRPVSSSTVVSLGYDPKSMTLEVEFTSGFIYHYYDVPELVARRLMVANSVGAHLNDRIRDHYRYVRVN